MMKSVLFTLIALTALMTTLPSLADERIQGAGSTFAYPLYSKWISEFQKKNPNIQVNYQSIGSGAGVRQFTDKTVDWGATDSPMKDDQIQKIAEGVTHIPTALGAVVIAFNLPGVKELKLSETALVDIFMGKIKTWNDPKILALNPSIKLDKSTPITPVYRSDSSGTTAVFADYLSKVSPEWKSKVGAETSLKWPVGMGAKGNEGVTGIVKQVPGTITYTELTFALNSGIPMAQLQNPAGEFILASVKSVSQAAESMKSQIPEDFRCSITRATGKGSYPISSFTYVVFRTQDTEGKGKWTRQFLKWGLSDGQAIAESIFYAPIPAPLRARILKKL